MPTHAQITHAREFVRWLDLGPGATYDPAVVVPAVIDPVPVFDPATQKVVEATPVVEADHVRRTWSVVAKSQDHLAREQWINNKIAQIDGALDNWSNLTTLAQLKAVLREVVEFQQIILRERRGDFTKPE